MTATRRHKYNAQATIVDGIRFASKAEAKRYGELCLLETAGQITALVIHPRFELMPKTVINGVKLRAITYIADFAYREDGWEVVEDVKGQQTPVFRLKRNLFLRRCPNKVLRIITT